MKRLLECSLPALCLVTFSAHAGTTYELVTRTMQGEEVDRMTFYDDGTQSRMDQRGSRSGSMSVIFKDDAFYVLDHAQKSFILMDEAMLDQMSSQINSAMQEMQEQLAAMPPEQRAMVEQMLNDEMPGLAGGQMTGPVLEIKPTGNGRWESYACKKYDMLEDGEKIQEICAADYKAIDGTGALRDSYRDMAKALDRLFEAIPFGGQGIQTPLQMESTMDGFPVHAVEFENGVAARETTLDSTAQQDIDPAMFEVPADYQQMDPFNP